MSEKDESQQVVNVTQKRGCTCCGTGCGVIALLPVVSVLAWSAFGIWVASALFAMTFGAGVVNQRLLERRRC